MAGRNPYFDFLRGIAIIMVVSIHTYTSEDSIELRQVMNLAVPLFIAISGFFLSRKPIESKKQYIGFLKKQVAKVYIPTMLWSLPWFVWTIGSGGNVVLNMIRLFVCGFSIYYFIAYIIQCYIALPVVSAIVKKCYRGGDFEHIDIIGLDRHNGLLYGD